MRSTPALALCLLAACGRTPPPGAPSKPTCTRPTSLPAARRAGLLPSHADLHRVQVPGGWQVNPPPDGQASGWLAVVKPQQPGARCRNMIWYAFVPGVDVARSEELIRTESLAFTTAFRRSTRLNRTSVQLGERGATRLSLAGEARRYRRLYLVPFPAGVLFVQCLTLGTMEDEQLCAAEHPALAALLVRAFEATPEGLARARLRARCEPPPAARRHGKGRSEPEADQLDAPP